MSFQLAINTTRAANWGRGKMAGTFEITFSNAFAWKKIFEFRIQFDCCFFPRGPDHNGIAMVQIMAWRRTGDKPLSEPMMAQVGGDTCKCHSASRNFITQSCFRNCLSPPHIRMVIQFSVQFLPREMGVDLIIKRKSKWYDGKPCMKLISVPRCSVLNCAVAWV